MQNNTIIRQPDGALTSVLGVDANRCYRRQQCPEFIEFTHWACGVPVATAHRINAQCINPDTLSLLIPADIAVVNIDTHGDLEWAEYLLLTRFAGIDYDC